MTRSLRCLFGHSYGGVNAGLARCRRCGDQLRVYTPRPWADEIRERQESITGDSPRPEGHR